MTKATLGIASGVAALLLAPSAQAQEQMGVNSITIEPQLSRSDAAGMRVEDGFDPEPINAGAVILAPSLSVVSGYTSNVFNRPNERSDAVLTLTPRLIARANSSRHLLQLSGMAVIRRFADNASENAEEFDLGARSVFDMSEGSELYANASFTRAVEPRSSIANFANAAEPVSYDQLLAQLGGSFELGSLTVAPAASYTRQKFQSLELTDGSTQDLSFRDLRTIGGSLTVAYRLGGTFSLFSRGSYADSQSIGTIVLARRDAETITVLGGIRGELSPVVTGELALGYRDRQYDAPQFLPDSGLTYSANLEWYPTELLSLRFTANQEYLSGGTQQVAGIQSNNFSLAAYYDPLRNLRLAVTAGLTVNDYRETDTTATRPLVRLQAQYRLNPNVSVGAFTSALRQDVSGSAIVNEFTALSAGVGITLTP